jgi:IS30 family transposase
MKNNRYLSTFACERTIKLNGADGSIILMKKPKKKFDTLDEAIEVAKKINSKSKMKVTSYKCKTCHKYHIGKNGNINKIK